jgi:3-isopropylmalate/(R)-2-methylmalate dehydratase large subunit
LTAARGPQTAVQKLLARAAGLDHVEIGEVVYPQPDLVTIHDGFVEGAYRELTALGYGAIRRPETVMFVTDHEVAYATPQAVARGAAIRDIARRWRIGHFYDVGRGGHGHLFPLEMGLVKPGMVIFAYDMHCTTFGAVGALAMGIGPEVTSVLATGSVWTQVPETVRIDVSGQLASGCHPRDAGFVLAQGFASGALGAAFDNRVLEFGGEGIADLDLAARVALINSVSELTIASVLFAGQGGPESDAEASYEARLTLDLSCVEPQVALPGGPERAALLATVEGRPIQHASIGSCGSGMYEDFVAAAGVLRGRRVAEGVRMFVTPGSVATAQRLAADGLAETFLEAGAILLPSGCGPCANGLMPPVGAGETSISTAAANHAGRLGAGHAFLASPLSVAASAISGCIRDPRRAHV